MRLGVVWEPNSAAWYRAVYPMHAMARRGHEIVWPADENGRADPTRLRVFELAAEGARPGRRTEA
jgi:hypothetical protein